MTNKVITIRLDDDTECQLTITQPPVHANLKTALDEALELLKRVMEQGRGKDAEQLKNDINAYLSIMLY